ncbi:MAG: periplasmic protein TorT [Rhodocyclaceae bacterium]|nr:periplasmic protein TorT [Rhodocyclaceae bacterium]
MASSYRRPGRKTSRPTIRAGTRDTVAARIRRVLGALALRTFVAGLLLAVTPLHAAGADTRWPIERWAGDVRATDAADRPPPALPALAASRPWRLCAVYPHLKDSYWLAVNYGMVEEARALGIGLRVLEAGGYEHLQRQRERVASCTSDPAIDALLVGTVSFGGLNDLLVPYRERHPVLGVVNDIDAGVVSARVGVPWYQLGWKIGRWLAARHPGGTPAVDIAWFPGPQDADWVGFIDRGFRDGLEGSAVRIATVRHGDTGRSIQRQLVEEALDAHPQLDYLVGNAPMAEAAVAELRRRQREDRLGIVASYVTPGVHSAMRRGRILASVTDFPVLQGRMAIRQGLRALEGQAIEAYIGPRVELVEPATLDRYPMDWMLPPAGFIPAYEVAPDLR